MKQKAIVILGSTGSIGTQALEVIRQHPESFNVIGLSAHSNWELLAEQIKEFKPEAASISVPEGYHNITQQATGLGNTRILNGSDSVEQLAELDNADLVLNALVGFAGFKPTVQALEAGKRVALANKESLVVGGELITGLLEHSRDQLVPVDSEHSAMLQCLVGEDPDSVEKIIVTASGGPFRTWSRDDLANITIEDALNHPNWSMGAKITIDSSTMMNKGLEIIETHWLFDVPIEKIEAVVHPQSIIHSIVTFVDGSSKAQLGHPDMKVPIQYALTYPERMTLETPRMSWDEATDFTFEPVDEDKFPCIRLAVEALEAGGFAPAILNAANEIAVERFLNGEITYIDIPKIVEESLQTIQYSESLSIESLEHVDRETRTFAKGIEF